MQHGYIYELERELARVHRRRLWPVWLFAFVVFLLGGIATVHTYYPRQPAPFVTGAR